MWQLEASNYNEAYAFLSTALAAFRAAYALEASAEAMQSSGVGGSAGGEIVEDVVDRREQGKDHEDTGGHGDAAADDSRVAGVGEAGEGVGGGSESGGIVGTGEGAGSHTARSWMQHEGRQGEELAGVSQEGGTDLVGGGFRGGGLTCEAEMQELAIFLEQVKQAEAECLLRDAQVCSNLTTVDAATFVDETAKLLLMLLQLHVAAATPRYAAS